MKRGGVFGVGGLALVWGVNIFDFYLRSCLHTPLFDCYEIHRSIAVYPLCYSTSNAQCLDGWMYLTELKNTDTQTVNT